MKLLITGGSGFIGRNIIEKLSYKYEILSPGHNKLELKDTSAVDLYFKQHDIDVVIHCAIKPGHRNSKDLQNQLYSDTLMFCNLLKNLDKYKKMVYVSSGAVYDTKYEIKKVKEEYYGTFIPVDEHGLFRYVASKIVQKENKVIEIRPFSVFGKYEDYAIRFISNAICKTLFDLPITIKQNRYFDFIYIDDLVRIIDHFVENDSTMRIYNATPDESIELKAVAEIICAISKKKLPILIANKGLGLEYSGCNRRLKNEIQSLRFTPIENAIKTLYDWYYNHKSEINKELLLNDK